LGYEFSGILGAERPILCGGLARPVRNWPGLRRFSPVTRASNLSNERRGGSAFIVGYCVDFVDDDGADAAEVFSAFACGEEDVEDSGVVTRIWGGLRSMATRSLGRVSPVRTRCGFRGRGSRVALPVAGSRRGGVEIFLHVVGEGFERADVDDLRAGREVARDGGAEELVDAD